VTPVRDIWLLLAASTFTGMSRPESTDDLRPR